MNKYCYFILVLLLSFAYSTYANDLTMGFSVFGFYIIGLLLLRLLISPSKGIVYNLYSLFFIIYGLLVLLTQIELISDPYQDYFVHKDAAHSFYTAVMKQININNWNSLIKTSYQNPAFVDYPLASLLMGAITKIGNDIGIVDLRLFQRIHIFVLGAMIVAIITEALCKRNLNTKKIRNFVVPFALCSYLYLTSAIFTRDIYIVVLYTLMGYYMLLPNNRWTIPQLIILALLATGMRPINGIFALLPIATVVYHRIGKRSPLLAKITIITTVIIFVVYADTVIRYGLNKMEYYHSLNLTNTGGLFIMFYNLPFPFNLICMSIHQLMMPLPIHWYVSIIEGGSLLTIPFMLSPFIMAMVYICSFWFIFKRYKQNKQLALYLLTSITLFILVTFGAPDLRRCFASVPMTYMGFCLIYQEVPKHLKKTIKQKVWSCIVVINIIILLYLNR